MIKEYICTVDHSKFNTEEELIKHMLKLYTVTSNVDEDKSSILKKFSESFPDSSVNVTFNEGIPNICLSLSNYDARFDFKINDDSSPHAYEIAYDSIEDAIARYKEMLLQVDVLVESVKNRFNATEVSVKQIYEGDPYGDSCDSALISFYVAEKQYHYSYEFETVEKALHKINGYFITSVEGKVVTDYEGYDSSNTVYIDDIDILDLANRAKRMRVEILEFKKD